LPREIMIPRNARRMNRYILIILSSIVAGILFIIMAYYNPGGRDSSTIIGLVFSVCFLFGASIFNSIIWATWVEARLTEDGIFVPGSNFFCRIVELRRYPSCPSYASWKDVTTVDFTGDGLCIVRTKSGKNPIFFVDQGKRDEVQGYFNQFMLRPVIAPKEK